MRLIKVVFSLYLFLMLTVVAYAQKDTVVTKQGDMLTGEIISLDHEILLLKTTYADNNIALKWDEINKLHTTSILKLSTIKNDVYIGSLVIDTNNRSVIKIVVADSTIVIKRDQILEITKFDKGHGRFKLDIDLGIITTKANNSDQVNLELALKYLARRWEFDLDYAAYAATVDTISNSRASLGLTAKYNFPENWFLITQVSSFTSSEQQIDYRVTYFLGAGKYLVRKRKLNAYGFLGATYNREKFTISETAFKTAEAFGGLYLESKPLDKLGIKSQLMAYPNLSEWGRVRVYSKTDVTLNFARHFRFGLGYVLNLDNRPPVTASKSDYLFNVKLGWSL